MNLRRRWCFDNLPGRNCLPNQFLQSSIIDGPLNPPEDHDRRNHKRAISRYCFGYIFLIKALSIFDRFVFQPTEAPLVVNSAGMG